jgi:N-acetylglucosamine kinase-like BadF-type ATPase
VLVAGTGSVAARIVNHRKTITAGGYGWLLGDEGSAFWIGREAVRATLRILRSDEAIGALAGAVLAEALGADGTQGDRAHSHARLITSANSEPPIRLARFASLVSAAAPADPQAMKIVDAAADLLAQQAFAVRTPGERTPIVLVGSVVGEGSPVGDALRERLDAPVESATDGAAGAAWLAAIEVLGPGAPRPS